MIEQQPWVGYTGGAAMGVGYTGLLSKITLFALHVYGSALGDINSN